MTRRDSAGVALHSDSAGDVTFGSKEPTNGEKTFDELGVTRPLPVPAMGFHPVPKPGGRKR